MKQPSWSRRDFLQRTLVGAGGVALAGVGAGVLGGCSRVGGGGTLQDAKDSGTISIGVANEKPYAYLVNGEPTGEAPELARVIFENMGIDKMEAEAVTFDALVNSLKNETFDVIAAGMFVTPERCQEVIFSEPDYCMQTAMLILKGSPAEGAASFEDVAKNPDIKLATMGTGVVEYQWALDAGIPKNQITGAYAELQDAVKALSDGRVDALALTRVTLATELESNPNPKLELSEPFFPVVDGEEVAGCGAFAFRKGDEDLRDAFNEELKKLQEADEVYPIVKEFGWNKEEVTLAAEHKTSELCSGAE